MRTHRVRELIVTYRANPDVTTPTNQPITNTPQAAALFVPLLETQAQEVFLIALLNARNRLLCFHEIGRGNLTNTVACPRIIVRAALLIDAAGIILAHNHPSGDPTPSLEDIQITKRIKEAAELFDIQVHDHLIIGERKFVSLKEYGTL